MEQEQINTSNSTNTVKMNFFKSLFYLLVEYAKNKPIKFWTNIVLLALSIFAQIIIRTDSEFIPSILSDEYNQLVNFSIAYFSAVYIMGLLVYCYWAVSPIKKDFVLSTLLIMIILISIATALCLIPVYNALRHYILPQFDLTLEEFGSFFASITGLLAFLAVIYTSDRADKRAKETIELAKAEAESNRIRAVKSEDENRLQAEEARQRYREDSERTIFFQLLDLHIKKIESVVFRDYKSSEAFKKYSDSGDDYLKTYWVCKYILQQDCFDKMINDLSKVLSENTGEEVPISNNKEIIMEFLKMIGAKMLNNDDFEFNYSTTEPKFKDLRDSINEQLANHTFITLSYLFENEVFDNILNIYTKDILKRKDYHLIYLSIKECSNIIYKNYGHILGHYFRNMYYVMDTIDKFSDKKNYKELFRAQLSRYELALGLFNAVGNNSSPRMIYLLESFDIFKDIYPDDIIILKSAKDAGEDPNELIKSILNEYKKDISNKSDNTQVSL